MDKIMTKETFQLSKEELSEINDLIAHNAFKRGASIEALKAVQKRRGWVSDEAVKAIAEVLEMSAEELDNVATFYSLIFRKPVGRHVIMTCDSVSCWIMGSDNIRKKLKEKLGVDQGQTTSDGKFTVLPNACLGCCDKAPALMVDDDLHVNVDPAKLDQILEKYK